MPSGGRRGRDAARLRLGTRPQGPAARARAAHRMKRSPMRTAAPPGRGASPPSASVTESPSQTYLLGTKDDEIERLGLQHRVWRPQVLACWRRAGITTGSRVLDLGAGPGFATVDLAEIVGPSGRVVAYERSPRFVALDRKSVV